MDFSDTGTGKTRGHIDHYNERPKPKGRMLVLCPMTLMRSAWGEDIEKFAPNLTVSFAYAGSREQAFNMQSDVVVMNIDGAKWLNKNPKYLNGFDHLVIDEITAYKNPQAARSKSVARIRKHFKYRYGLTGTPNPNSVTELWHPMLIVDDGKLLGTSFYKFRSAVCIPERIGPGINHVKWVDKPGINMTVQTLIQPITIRHAFEDVMKDVPPNHRNTKTFELASKARKAYDAMEHDCILAHEDATITAVHAASMRTKLLQIASGAVYSGEGQYVVIDDTRYELIADLVAECAHSVVFFNWRHQRELLCALFEKRGITFAVIDGSTDKFERDAIVTRYQAGVYRTILLHPRTGAHGLTLTRGDTTIFASPLYEADLMVQGLARIYRGGQTKVTNTIFVEAANTVEKLVYERLNGKYDRMVDLLDSLKQRRRR